MAKKLKECPFCGSNFIDINPIDEDFQCFCGDCGATGALATGETTAKILWNTRSYGKGFEV
jgi:Lar family restriction alleviation protein